MAEVLRHIEGGTAVFNDGCLLTSFMLYPSARVTDRLTVKAVANCILIYLRPRSMNTDEIKSVLNEMVGPVKFIARADSLPQRRGFWSNIICFHHPKHALAAIRHFKAIPQMDADLLYTIFFSAPNEICEAVSKDVEEIVRDLRHGHVLHRSWTDGRSGSRTLRITSPRQEIIMNVKQVLVAIFSGKVASQSVGRQTDYEMWHDFFGHSQGDIWLKRLLQGSRLVAVSDKSQHRLRLYDPNSTDSVLHIVEMEIAEKVADLDASRESHTISFDRSSLRDLMSSGTVAKAQKLLGPENVSLDIIAKRLTLFCYRSTAWSTTYKLNLPFPESASSVKQPNQQCPICAEPTTDVRLSCSHVLCRECFDHQLNVASTDLSSHHFPLRCWEGNCSKPISLTDLRKYATGPIIDSLLKASLTFYIRTHPDEYRNCRKVDCDAVYLLNSPNEIVTCPTCLTQTCTRCHCAPHIGWTCAEYVERVKIDSLNEQLLEEYKYSAGTKECPKCCTLLEKVDGCNHIECSGCHVHICWACLTFFRKPDKCYEHMNLVHGGDGLDDLDDYDSESESESEEDEYEYMGGAEYEIEYEDYW